MARVACRQAWRCIFGLESKNIVPGSPKLLWCYGRIQGFSAGMDLENTVRPKIRIKKDHPLDYVADEEKFIAPLLRIRDTFLRFKKDAIPLRHLTIRRRNLGLRTTEERFEDYIDSYPTLFQIFTHPDEKLPWIKLTPQLVDLIEQERRVNTEQEALIIDKLRRFLMLAQDQQIRANRVLMAAPFLGFPSDLVARIVPRYPQYFSVVQRGKPYQTIELVAWDEILAVSELERKAKAAVKGSGHGQIKTRGSPLTFKTKYSAGVVPRKKALAYLEEWQKIPYISPYEDVRELKHATPLGDRRLVAVLHEILSLTIEKKITTEVLYHFRKEFDLPGNLYKAINHYPGIFYISVQGAVHTLYLREGYEKSHLSEGHPLVSLKEQFLKLARNGPRMRTMLRNMHRNRKY